MAENITYCIYNKDAYDISNFDLNILVYSHANLKNDWVADPKMVLPYSKCYCILDGEAELITESQIIKMTAGNIYIVPSGFPCGYSCDNKASKLFFHFKLAHTLSHDIFSAANQIIILENKQDFINQLYSVFKEESFTRGYEIKNHLYQICIEATKKYNINEHSFPKYSGITKKALRIINNHLNMNYKCEQLAEELNYSPRALERLFKKELGRTVNQHIKYEILQHAASDLLLTNLLINEISQKYGFSDQFYFSRAFKAKYNISPEKYRKPIT